MIDGDAGVPLARYLDRRVRDSMLLRPDWTVPAAVQACTTLRRGLQVGISAAPFDDFNLGAACGDLPSAVQHNREALGWIAQLPAPPQWLRQVHGVDVVRVDAMQPAPEADAAVTGVPGRVLAILTADCLPVLFCSDGGDEVAAAHAGWRGLAAGVLERTVAAMRTPASRLQAWLGPAAGPRAYEVGDEVRAAFVTQDARAGMAFAPTRSGHWRVDLYALARQRLAAVGIARVRGGDLCTISDPQRFYSHRRDGRSGRMATLIWITPPR